MFADEKPMEGCGIYNKKVHRSPLDGSVPFVDTGFDICNNNNLMAAIKYIIIAAMKVRKIFHIELASFRELLRHLIIL